MSPPTRYSRYRESICVTIQERDMSPADFQPPSSDRPDREAPAPDEAPEAAPPPRSEVLSLELAQLGPAAPLRWLALGWRDFMH